MGKILCNLLRDIKEEISPIFVPIQFIVIGSNNNEIVNPTDIDIILIVDNDVDVYSLVHQISSKIVALIIKHRILISIYPIRKSCYDACETQFINNIHRYGISF